MINSNIRFKTSTIRSNLCDYNDACILAKGTITVLNMAVAGVAVSNTNKKIDCVTEMNDDAQKSDIVMPMYNLIEYSDAYLKTS